MKTFTCEICKGLYPDYIREDLEMEIKIDGQTILHRKRSLCPNCRIISIATTVDDSEFFPKTQDDQSPLIPHFDRNGDPCPDCSVAVGEKHHSGCDQEICPVCGRQLLSCGHEIVDITSEGC